VTKELFSEKDLDELGLLSKSKRDRYIKTGRLPAPIKLGGPNGKRLHSREIIDAIKALTGKSQAASA